MAPKRSITKKTPQPLDKQMEEEPTLPPAFFETAPVAEEAPSVVPSNESSEGDVGADEEAPLEESGNVDAPSKRVVTVSGLVTLNHLVSKHVPAAMEGESKENKERMWREVFDHQMTAIAELVRAVVDEKGAEVLANGIRVNFPPFGGHKSTMVTTVRKDAQGTIRATINLHDSFKKGHAKNAPEECWLARAVGDAYKPKPKAPKKTPAQAASIDQP